MRLLGRGLVEREGGGFEGAGRLGAPAEEEETGVDAGVFSSSTVGSCGESLSYTFSKAETLTKLRRGKKDDNNPNSQRHRWCGAC